MPTDPTLWSPATAIGPEGPAGPAIELQVTATYIQWRVVGDTEWINLVALADLIGPQGDTGTGTSGAKGIKGDKGDTGVTGPTGATGAAGADGISPVIYNDSGVPSVGLGIDGDYYIDTDNGDLYYKDTGVWGSPVANITGPQGDTGAAGSDGADGADGVDGISNVIWYVGAGVPSPTLGNANDMYLDSSTGDIYKKVAVTGWGSPVANIAGATGPMDPAVYDPSTIAADVFNMDNMVEGSTNLILSGAERLTISTNVVNISSLGVLFTTLDSDLTVAESGIATNTANISTNILNISTNAANISTNVAGISTNVTNIATNASNIAVNASNIVTNTGAISTLTSMVAALDVSTLASTLVVNSTNIATNSTNISTNILGISTNTAAIATLVGGKVVTTEASTTRTLALSDTNLYLLCTNAAGCTITVAAQASVAWSANAEIHGRGTLESIAFAADTGVSINVPSGFETDIVAGAMWTLKRESSDSWALAGYLVETP